MPEPKDSWTVGSYVVERGSALPFGATEHPTGINFSLFSKNSTAATLAVFLSGIDEPVAEIPLDPHLNRTGDVWHILVRKLDASIRYGWRLDGPNSPRDGHRYNPDILLIDPYAKAITGGEVWGTPVVRQVTRPDQPASLFPRRGCLAPTTFDWEGDNPPLVAMEDSIIYEMHVRGFTVDPSSCVTHPGTFMGLAEKIPYLKELGVTAVELMPVAEFDECEHDRKNPRTGEMLRNFWGYSPIAFFAPKANYAANGRDGLQVNEFREMVKAFHRAGIEVILDVVFNHTGEGDERGQTLSFRGIDNKIYYLLDERGQYRNFSGCGNTFNCNDPITRELIRDCLRYWVAEMHVDGFRFDLASILGRGPSGEVLPNPPLLEMIAVDPVLADAKVIAEAWDAAGVNQVGRFPSWGRWAEWNGYYRDQIRLFWKGEKGFINHLATRICGSEDLYRGSGRSPYHSINFITAHDGFTLMDLVSYESKHNLDNAENNRDGEDHNHSVNFGHEGPTSDGHINNMRKRQIKNFCATLLLSQGVPMILAGDEFGRTQKGNNNPYCQDNDTNWVNWNLLNENADLHRFFQGMIAFRKRHKALRRAHFFGGTSDISWHGENGQPDWSEEACWLAFLLDGNHAAGGPAPHIFVMMNASSDHRHFQVPDMGREWRKVIDTARPSPEDLFFDEDKAPNAGYRHDRYAIEPRSLIVLTTR